ncbi:TRAP transporter small permease [Roseococcus sp. YIM B11640]|uniref:TRAP transporter small permease n=1 Tax=Roseococcus sp. YIM B11640 TaxID=3133973 RepID=UPI003C7DEE21
MPSRGPLGRLAAALAVAGGLVLLATALLTTLSVLMRWLTNQPIRGDFELVSLGSGLAVLAFLPWGSRMRSNILVDSFTTRLSARANGVLDAFWSLAWAATTLLIAERMARGAVDSFANGMRTMGLLSLPYWWAVAIGALCFALAGLAALAWIPRLARGEG